MLSLITKFGVDSVQVRGNLTLLLVVNPTWFEVGEGGGGGGGVELVNLRAKFEPSSTVVAARQVGEKTLS